jgi:hypothetical protein
LSGFATTFTHLTGDAFAARLSVSERRVEGTWLIKQYHATARMFRICRASPGMASGCAPRAACWQR